MIDVLKQAINGTTVTLLNFNKLLWNIHLELCFKEDEFNRHNLNRLLAKKAGKAVMNSILDDIIAKKNELETLILNKSYMNANIVSRGGVFDNYCQYQRSK